MKIEDGKIVLEHDEYKIKKTKADRDSARWAELMKVRAEMLGGKGQ